MIMHALTNICAGFLLAAAIALPASAEEDYRAAAIAMVKRDFRDRGQAKTDRLINDAVQAVCNRYDNAPPAELAKMMEANLQKDTPFPADGKLLGSWKSGEQIAQSGRGFTWSDAPAVAVGGNCYNCHQLAPQEISYGTLGPSLRNFGKIRGNTPETQRYVFAKIYNAKSFNLCSAMPRFGHVGALTESQIKDLVALILDAESPVNK
jgi:sulfur-oxidizing protein SoxX